MARNIVQLQKISSCVFWSASCSTYSEIALSCLQDAKPKYKTRASASDGYECSLSKVCLPYNLPIADLLYNHSR